MNKLEKGIHISVKKFSEALDRELRPKIEQANKAMVEFGIAAGKALKEKEIS